MAVQRPHVDSDLPFHLTARHINKDEFPIPLSEVWLIMEDYLAFVANAYGLEINAFVLMPNHWHLIAAARHGNWSDIMSYLMRETSIGISRSAGRINQVYGNRHFRCLIDSHHYYLHAYKYVYRNPVRAHLVQTVEKYPFSTLHGLLGFRRMAIPMVEDQTLFSDIEGTIKWLNEHPSDANTSAVRSALRHQAFKLPRIERNKSVHPLSILSY